MAALVTLEEVKTGLRVDSSDDNSLLTTLIGAASEAVIAFLKADEDTELFDYEAALNNSPQDADVDDLVKQATIVQVDYFYRGDFENVDPNMTLCPAATALLRGKRTPTIA